MSDNRQVEQEDRQIIQRMASKDANALDTFYRRYSRLAFSFIFRIVGNRFDAEDVLSDVFWQVWQQSPRYDASRGKPIAWLLTIARTRAIDCLRSSSRQQLKTEEFDTQKDPAPSMREPDSFVLADTRQAVEDALGAPPNNRESRSKWHTFRESVIQRLHRRSGSPWGL